MENVPLWRNRKIPLDKRHYALFPNILVTKILAIAQKVVACCMPGKDAMGDKPVYSIFVKLHDGFTKTDIHERTSFRAFHDISHKINFIVWSKHIIIRESKWPKAGHIHVDPPAAVVV